MQNFRNLKVWEKAHKHTLEVYNITSNFPKAEIYGLTIQIRRSVSSIVANIAEGCGKSSKKDFANYLQIALGSAHETEYFLLLSRDLNYISTTEHEVLNQNINEIKGMLIGLVKKVNI
ncbi:four helix bundle protein [Sporocytophaga myxococcoides]|uniref:four helix bundle protein n=1 Tax=Sporocytophaga myxococcoides TaxID=153721 RepID=UPI0005ED9E4D|nr:four helix bundle protein [Sporocytophaga myxococcoides]